MEDSIESAYERLAAWCRDRNYEGHDPFDGLNSRLFQSTPLKRSRVARLAWTQIIKRSPFNFRRVLGISAGKNPKGTALFALAALSRFRKGRTRESEAEARTFIKDLLAARIDGFSGDCWGYNFDWQGRAFFAPQGTPMIVPTAFAARALLEASQAFNDESYLQIARSACDFILIDVNRTNDTKDEICWSYSPLDRTHVFNASLLAAETLASVSALTGEKPLCELAERGARYVVRRQRDDGSWAYGGENFQSWADNFHTAFILTSLSRIMRTSGMAHAEFYEATKRGYEFWKKNFFLSDGWPKYYPDRLYPADAHSAGAAIVSLLEMQEIDDDAEALAQRIALWATQRLQDQSGFFYYQLRRLYTVRTPYMRWSQAWMMYAFARLLEERT